MLLYQKQFNLGIAETSDILISMKGENIILSQEILQKDSENSHLTNKKKNVFEQPIKQDE